MLIINELWQYNRNKRTFYKPPAVQQTCPAWIYWTVTRPRDSPVGSSVSLASPSPSIPP